MASVLCGGPGGTTGILMGFVTDRFGVVRGVVMHDKRFQAYALVELTFLDWRSV